MEADDITLFQRWIADWQEVVEFEVVPVVEGKTTREALTPLLDVMQTFGRHQVILSVAKDLMPVASGDEVLRCAQDDRY